MRDRWYAHNVLFPHRHKDASAGFHRELVDSLHGRKPRNINEIFRGGAKSTYGEEAKIIRALFGEYRNCIIIGSSWERAVERLRSIRHELESNERIAELFGNQVGVTWTESRIVLSNGVAIQAYGRGQSLRGVKHYDARPDECLCDDFEEEDSVRSEESIQRCISWFYAVLLPSLDPKARIDILGTPMDPNSVLVQLEKDPEWNVLKVPIEYMDDDGVMRSSWESRFPKEQIDAMRERYERKGLLREYNQEYMCRAEAITDKVFHASHIQVIPQQRRWQPVYAIYDPARTVKEKSAHTGKIVAGWVGNKLTVWEASGNFWKPDEIFEDIFKVQEQYSPVEIAVEENSLEEFIMQPLRSMAAKRGITLPIRSLRAPKGKLDFIKGLAPYFSSGEIVFAKEFPDLREQLLNFPSGRIDVPNALAYMMKVRNGMVIYEDFSEHHVVNELFADSTQIWIAVNSDEIRTSAVAVQYHNGVMKILGDWIEDGDAGARLSGIIDQIHMDLGGKINLRAPLHHFDRWRNLGLIQAAKKSNLEITRGAETGKGRELLRRLMTEMRKGRPAFQVDSRAKWTINALSGGYCMEAGKRGEIKTIPIANAYSLLMEGLESFSGSADRTVDESTNSGVRYETTKDGRSYISARA